jgi:signal transduction histidine kinase
MSLLFSNAKEKNDGQMSRQAMEACEHIIAEMGAELHDDLIQRLSIFRLSLDRLERSLADKAAAEVLLMSMKSDFQEVIQSVRKISRKLLPVKTHDCSLQECLALLCQNMERPGTGNIHFDVAGHQQPLPSVVETYLMRIVQELIHNSYKHSSAWHVWVRLQWQNEELTIEVEDDGTGFTKVIDFIQPLRKKYNTLRMRCDAIGATIQYCEGSKGLRAIVKYGIPKL